MPRARGGSNGAGGPEGRWVAMLRGWRRQRANLIFAPLAMPLPPLLSSESPLSSILLLAPPAATVRVSLTHNTPACSLYLAVSFTRYIRPGPCYRRRRRRRRHCRCFGVSSTLAYFAQSVPMYSTGSSLSLFLSLFLCVSVVVSLKRLTPTGSAELRTANFHYDVAVTL